MWSNRWHCNLNTIGISLKNYETWCSNTLTADWFLPKLLKNAKRIRAKVRLPQSYKVDFWQQLNLLVIYHAKKTTYEYTSSWHLNQQIFLKKGHSARKLAAENDHFFTHDQIFFHDCEVALTSHICFPIRLEFHQHLN